MFGKAEILKIAFVANNSSLYDRLEIELYDIDE